MFPIDLVFVWILKYLVVTFAILGIASLLLRTLWQPVEKVSLVRITLACLVVAFLITSVSWLPKIELEWLPPSEQAVAKIDRLENATKNSSQPLPTIKMANPVASSSAPTSPIVAPSSAFHTPEEASLRVPAEPSPVPVASAGSIWSWTGAYRVGKTIFVWTILLVSLAHLLWVGVGFLVTRRLLRDSHQLACHHQARIRAALCQIAGSDITHVGVRSSEQIQVPIVIGIFTPCIILPSSMLRETLDAEQLDHCLAHEWKHIERQDLFTWGMASLLQPLLWMQPFYWSMRRELRVCQDQIADQFAAQIAEQHADYAATLVKFSKSYDTNLMGALSMAGSKSNVYRRVEMLLNSKFQLAGASRRRVVMGLVVLMTLGSFALASMQPVRASLPDLSASILDQQEDEKQADTNDEKEKATEAVEYTGVVIDSTTRAPIVGAIVTVRRENSSTRKTIDETKHTTDEQGKYTFSIPPEQQNERYLYIELDVEHDTYCSKMGFGYAYSMILKNIKLGEAPFYSETALSPGEAVFGRLVDEAGDPMPGVKVSAYSVPPSDGNSFGIGSFDKVVSDKDGKFKMNFAKDGNSILWIQPEQLAMRQIMTGIERGDLGDIQLQKGFEVSGKVVDALGEVVPNVWVEIEDLDAQSEIQMPVATSMRRYAKTDAQGQYSAEPMNAGNYRIKVSKSGPTVDENGKDHWETVKVPGVFPTQRFEIKADSGVQDINLQGVPHVYVSGQFYNSQNEPTGGHMPHLFGKVEDDSYMFFEAEKGEEKGQFSAMVPHGIQDVRISFMTNEHSSLRVQIGDGELLTTTRDIEIGTIEEDFDQIKVYRYVAPIIQIKVVDVEGNVLEDASVGANYVGKESEAAMLTTGMRTTVFFEKQKDGYHRSSQLCPDAEFEYFAQLENYEQASDIAEMKENETQKVTLTMKKIVGTETSGTRNDSEMQDKDK